jgi:hypothetical protein
MSKLNLVLHCGAELTDRLDPRIINTPQSIGPRHAPFAYADMINGAINAFQSFGLVVKQQAYGTLKDGSRFFGMLELSSNADDYSTIVGLRASHDQSIAAGIAAGTGVIVCDNLSFSGEVTIGTRQTTNVMERLPQLIYQAASKTRKLIEHQHDRIETYKKQVLPSRVGDAAIIELVRRGAVNPSQVGRLIEEYDTPSHAEFEEPNIWRLHNAVTEIYKPTNGHTNMAVMPKRSTLLTEFCDQLAGLNF